MAFFDSYWRRRAEAAEMALAECKDRLTFAQAALQGMKHRFEQRTVLVSITRENRRIIFTFARRNEIHQISAIGTWNDDLTEWKKLLIDPLPDANDAVSTEE